MFHDTNPHLQWNRRFLIICCALEIAYGIISMLFAVALNEAVNIIGSAERFEELLLAGMLTILSGVMYPASRAVAEGATLVYGERASEAVRNKLNKAIFSMNSAEFSEKDTGDYLNSMSGDVLLLCDQYYTQIPLIFGYAAQFAFCVIYSFILNPVIGIVLMFMSVIQYLGPKLFEKKLKRCTINQSEMSACFMSKAKELLLGYSVVKSYGGEQAIQKEFYDSNRKMTAAREKASVLTRISMSTYTLLALMMVVLPVLTAGYFVMAGTMAPATLLTIFYISNRYCMPVMDFSKAFTNIKSSQTVREKLNHFLNDHPESAAPSANRIQNGIEVKNLNFSYHQDAPALYDVSFAFQMGKKYLLTGESGCGKSTLLKVIAGQYPSGSVYVDGRSVETMPPGSLAGRLVLVSQQPYIFRRSVAGNIDFLGTGDRTKIQKAADMCCLTEFVSSLPQGADTMVDEEQRQLSGGQKARIGLARALYARPDVLLLDEVTGALDPETAHEIEEMILNLRDVLVIHVSHKPSADLIAKYDEVLTMEQGRLIKVDEIVSGSGRG